MTRPTPQQRAVERDAQRLEAVARRMWDEAAEHADKPASTVNCPHGRRWCDGCEDRMAQLADRAMTERDEP